MTNGDQVQVMALGRGMELSDFPAIELKKMSPRLLKAMGAVAGRAARCR